MINTRPSIDKMYRILALLVLLLAPAISPSKVDAELSFAPLIGDGYQHSFQSASSKPKRVAVIGAGAAGASTAFHLYKYASENNVNIAVDVFERSSYIGGKAMTADIYGDPQLKAEVGASVFSKDDKLLMSLVDEFSLDLDELQQDWGIWNYGEWPYIERDHSWWWWNTLKLLWKYGYSPHRLDSLTRDYSVRFKGIFDDAVPPLRSLKDAARNAGLYSAIEATESKFLRDHDISCHFVTEIVEAFGRASKGRRLDQSHALETLLNIKFWNAGRVSIAGGNNRLFTAMLTWSGAKVHLSTNVTDIIYSSDGTYRVKSVGLRKNSSHEVERSGQTSENYDAAVLATPFSTSAVELPGKLGDTLDSPPCSPYRVFFFTNDRASLGTYNKMFWPMFSQGSPPHEVLTTDNVYWWKTIRRHQTGLAYAKENETVLEDLYRVDDFFAYSYDWEGMSLGGMEHLPRWDYKHNWEGPDCWRTVGRPRSMAEGFDEVQLAPGLYYTGGMEQLWGTMESNALMGRNIARLIAKGW